MATNNKFCITNKQQTMAAGAIIGEIALKAKQDYDKAGERAMNHIEKAYKQQTEERQSNSGWTGGGDASHAQPQQQAPVVVNIKKDKGEGEDEKAAEEAKPHTAGEVNTGDDVVGDKTGAGSWLEDVLNTVGTK